MEQDTPVSGSKDKKNADMALECKLGQMERGTKVNGKITKLMVEVLFGMCMATSMKVTGLTIKLKDKEFTHMLMELSMRVSGTMIFSTDTVLRFGLTGAGIVATTNTDGNTGKGNINGPTGAFTMESGAKIKFMARVAMNGLTADPIMEIG